MCDVQCFEIFFGLVIFQNIANLKETKRKKMQARHGQRDVEEESSQESSQSFESDYTSDDIPLRASEPKKKHIESQMDPSESHNVRMIARIEAKVNQVHNVLLQLQRMMISSQIAGSEIDASSQLQELPLQTVESLSKFEADLGVVTYRKQVVSNIIF